MLAPPVKGWPKYVVVKILETHWRPEKTQTWVIADILFYRIYVHFYPSLLQIWRMRWLAEATVPVASKDALRSRAKVGMMSGEDWPVDPCWLIVVGVIINRN